jgi:hypothetical protein
MEAWKEELSRLEHQISELEERNRQPLPMGTAAPAVANVVPLPRPNPPAASAAPQYDYNANQDWKNFVDPDGSIRPTPRGRGHYWGPV